MSTSYSVRNTFLLLMAAFLSGCAVYPTHRGMVIEPMLPAVIYVPVPEPVVEYRVYDRYNSYQPSYEQRRYNEECRYHGRHCGR